MRHPKMSTGAWIFATAALVLAVAAPVSYAAATSTVAIGDTSNTQTAEVINGRLLSSSTWTQDDVARDIELTSSGCSPLYTPPAGKAIVLTSVTFEIDSGSESAQSLTNNCSGGGLYDSVYSGGGNATFQHTFPTGLPLTGVAVTISGVATGDAVAFTGYLIPSTQLPPTGQVSQRSRHQLAHTSR